jgi:hypothetical protein
MKSLLYVQAGEVFPQSSLNKISSSTHSIESGDDLIDISYIATKLHRRMGYIIGAKEALQILKRFEYRIDRFSRKDCVKLLQICSLSINRSMDSSQGELSRELIRLRCSIVTEIIKKLESRCEHFSTNEIGVVISALSRMFEHHMTSFIFTLCDILKARTVHIIETPDVNTPSIFLSRSELHRVIPFALLGLQQNGLPLPESFVRASIELFSIPYLSEVPYQHLSLYVFVVSGSRFPESRSIIEYALDRIADSADDMTVLDVARIGSGAITFDKSLATRVAKHVNFAIPRKKAESDIHGVLALVRCVSECEKPIPRRLAHKMAEIIHKVRRSLPKDYLMEIEDRVFGMNKEGS